MQGELFKVDGEVASARPQSLNQQRYLMTASVPGQGGHAGPSVAASSDAADDHTCLHGLMQQEQLLKKQASRKRRSSSAKSHSKSMGCIPAHEAAQCINTAHTHVVTLLLLPVSCIDACQFM